MAGSIEKWLVCAVYVTTAAGSTAAGSNRRAKPRFSRLWPSTWSQYHGRIPTVVESNADHPSPASVVVIPAKVEKCQPPPLHLDDSHAGNASSPSSKMSEATSEHLRWVAYNVLTSMPDERIEVHRSKVSTKTVPNVRDLTDSNLQSHQQHGERVMTHDENKKHPFHESSRASTASFDFTSGSSTPISSDPSAAHAFSWSNSILSGHFQNDARIQQARAHIPWEYVLQRAYSGSSTDSLAADAGDDEPPASFSDEGDTFSEQQKADFRKKQEIFLERIDPYKEIQEADELFAHVRRHVKENKLQVARMQKLGEDECKSKSRETFSHRSGRYLRVIAPTSEAHPPLVSRSKFARSKFSEFLGTHLMTTSPADVANGERPPSAMTRGVTDGLRGADMQASQPFRPTASPSTCQKLADEIWDASPGTANVLYEQLDSDMKKKQGVLNKMFAGYM